MLPVGLLSLALFAPTAPNGPDRGDELTYSGTVAEAVDRPGNRYRRGYDLEVRILTLDRHTAGFDAAVLTLLRRSTDRAVAGAVSAVTGAAPDRGPPASRLDLVRVGRDGMARLLAPAGPAPLFLKADTPVRPIPTIPLDGSALFEFGAFLPCSPELFSASGWVLPEPGRPPQNWLLEGREFITAEQCLRLKMTQQSADWDQPIGGQTAWQRVDTIWLSTADRTVRRVHRLIQQRDGVNPAPAVWVEVRYELTGQTRVINRAFDRYRREIEVGYTASSETAPLLPAAARLGPTPFATRLDRLDAYLQETEPGTPYREAVLAVRRQLEAARRGESAPLVARAPAPSSNLPPLPNGVSPFRLTEHRGKPIALIFFAPGGKTTDLTLAVANALRQKYAGRVVVAPVVVFGDPAAAVADRVRMGFTLPIHHSPELEKTYGVDAVPRFMVIDPAGIVRWTFDGVGAETGYLVREQLDRLLEPPRLE